MVAALIMGAAIRPRPVFVKIQPPSFPDAIAHRGWPNDQTRNPALQRLDSGFALTRAARLCRAPLATAEKNVQNLRGIIALEP